MNITIIKTKSDNIRYVKDRINRKPKHLRTREIERLAEELEVSTRTIRIYYKRKI